MTMHIQGVLDPEELRRCRATLAGAPWLDGRATAGDQSARAKRNLQAAEGSPEVAAAGELVLRALGRNAGFMSAALPLRVYPPLFNRYGEGMSFGDHVDNAIRTSPVSGQSYRTDLSATLFLSDPGDYDGGELVIGEGAFAARVKLAAGDVVLYPTTSVHRVEPVTRGERWASFFWVQSLVADPGQRTLLRDLDRAIGAAREGLGDEHPAAVSLVGAYHNLVRMWAQP
ncbi:MAG: Fe2+-dependent dioxygenase [Caulobacteraceae bacterium]|nr:Fe2+-dependent dioxygenase [Caulobacteraceae bacterium]